MDAALLNSLLNQSESESLDFKREQYRFVGEPNRVKSELLKDILAMANAWKSSDAYILIGVEEQTGAKATVVGISTHLDDANLQQFVHAKTNKPLSFGYSVVPLGGKDVGVITIAAGQVRPVYLSSDFGKLCGGVVYIRRGSSTGRASPDEIAEMGEDRVAIPAVPSIAVEFADTRKRLRLGTQLAITSTLLVDPPPLTREQLKWLGKHLSAIKLIESPATRVQIPRHFLNSLVGEQPTPEQIRERHQELAFLTSVGFLVQNCGSVTATDVRIEVHGSKTDGLLQFDELSHPKNRASVGVGGSMPSVFRSNVQVEEHGANWTLSVDVGKLQPKSDVWITDQWYIGSANPTRLDLRATIFADNLPDPISTPLIVTIELEESVYDKDRIKGAVND